MYRVEGYEFETKEVADAAGREQEGIKYLRAQVRMDDPDMVLSLYNKLIIRSVFETPVGYRFLAELQEYLQTRTEIAKEDIRPIPVYTAFGKNTKESWTWKVARKHAKNLEKIKKEMLPPGTKRKKDYRKAYHNSLIVSGVCVAVIIGMFIITILSGNNVTILNYENAVIDKYEAWQQELEEREAAVSQREAQLE